MKGFVDDGLRALLRAIRCQAIQCQFIFPLPHGGGKTSRHLLSERRLFVCARRME